MNHNGRLNQLEKKLNQVTGAGNTSRIKVSHLEGEAFEKSYALFQAKLKLGLVKFDEPKRIFASADKGFEDKYENLTTEQAKKYMR